LSISLLSSSKAGVSVGSLYQYFPHKQALIYAVNARYLDRVAAMVEAACLQRHGATLPEMVDGLVTVYADAKLEKPDVTRALYRSIAELDVQSQIEAFSQRVDAATLAMFRSAPDAEFENLDILNLTLLTAIFGAIRNIFERGLSVPDAKAVHAQLKAMCTAYLESMRAPSLMELS
jgi:AcrR family transcriptional regulator